MQAYHDDAKKIPVVDLSCLDCRNLHWDLFENEKIDELAEHFRIALHRSGLIFIKNHGISQKLVSQ